jgi:serine/alanine adding enzyme
VNNTSLTSLKVDLTCDNIAWDNYVETSPDASNYHRWLWRQVIEETFGHKAYYITATADGAIQGVLPLFEIRSRLFVHFMVSVPFFSHGGVLASSAEVRHGLLAKAEKIGRELGVRHIELRQSDECNLGWSDEASKVILDLPLPSTVEGLFQSFPGKLRNRIRHSETQGFELQVSGLEGVANFYHIFAANMRHLGTPVYPRTWFENICRHEPRQTRILTACKMGKPVAAAFVIGFRDTLEVPWSASLPEFRRDYSAMWLEWKMFSWAVENGYRCMDLGRSTPGSSSHMFKRQWTKNERPLHWYYWLAPGASLPSLRKENSRFDLAIKIWRCLPLGLTKWLGPRIVRSIP